MDPDANLEAALERARELIALIDTTSTSADERLENTVEHGPDVVDLASELAQLVVALDEWLSKGGHLPRAWSKVAWQNGVTLAQAIVLGSKVKPADTMHVTLGGAGLSDTSLYVTYTNDRFVLGIDREGSASS